MRIVENALTFDDVLLQPAYSEVLPRDVSLVTRLTRDIELNDFWDMRPSPDGRKVAFSRMGGDGALCVRDIASGETVQLTTGERTFSGDRGPVWSPDGTRIAYRLQKSNQRSGTRDGLKRTNRFEVDLPGGQRAHTGLHASAGAIKKRNHIARCHAQDVTQMMRLVPTGNQHAILPALGSKIAAMHG